LPPSELEQQLLPELPLRAPFYPLFCFSQMAWLDVARSGLGRCRQGACGRPVGHPVWLADLALALTASVAAPYFGRLWPRALQSSGPVAAGMIPQA